MTIQLQPLGHVARRRPAFVACVLQVAVVARARTQPAHPIHAAVRHLCLLAMFCLVARAGQAQQPSPALKPNPVIAMRAFEPAAEEEYELGPGDEITISFAGRPELDVKRIVGPDGKVTLPLAGAVNLKDKTREQAADAVVAALSLYYSSLSATVGVDRYTSNRILLLGAVQRPGIVTFDRPPTLLEAITRGGVAEGGTQQGFSGGAGAGGGSSGGSAAGGMARTIPAVPDRCAIYRGSDQVLWVDLKKLLETGNAMADMRLKRDDIVYVPSSTERYVSVLGQVQHPGALLLDDNTTLAKLLAEAGGTTDQAGRYPDIQIIQPATGTSRTVSFKSLLNPGALDLTLHSGDVIYIPKTGFNRATYALERISPLVTMFTAAALFNR